MILQDGCADRSKPWFRQDNLLPIPAQAKSPFPALGSNQRPFIARLREDGQIEHVSHWRNRVCEGESIAYDPPGPVLVRYEFRDGDLP